MKKYILHCILICGIAVVVFADKKTADIAIRLVRMEGKPAPDIVVYPSEFTIGKTVSWKKSADANETKNGDDPVLEYTSADPATLSFDLFFDGFETRDNVYLKNVAPLEGLAAVDPALKRPPIVKVTFDPAVFPTFTGVVGSVSTKYTMFLADGTPVRATTNVTMKKASDARISKNPCP